MDFYEKFPDLQKDYFGYIEIFSDLYKGQEFTITSAFWFLEKISVSTPSTFSLNYFGSYNHICFHRFATLIMKGMSLTESLFIMKKLLLKEIKKFKNLGWDEQTVKEILEAVYQAHAPASLDKDTKARETLFNHVVTNAIKTDAHFIAPWFLEGSLLRNSWNKLLHRTLPHGFLQVAAKTLPRSLFLKLCSPALDRYITSLDKDIEGNFNILVSELDKGSKMSFFFPLFSDRQSFSDSILIELMCSHSFEKNDSPDRATIVDEFLVRVKLIPKSINDLLKRLSRWEICQFLRNLISWTP